MKTLPYQRLLDQGWVIVGMNHYFIDKERRLFCAMTRGGVCIKSEDKSDLLVFQDLERQAEKR